MERQYTGWGYIDWLHSEKKEQEGAMRVGIVSMRTCRHICILLNRLFIPFRDVDIA